MRLERLPGAAVDRVFKEGKRVHHPMATLICRRNDASGPSDAVRLGVVVSRGVARDAVPRNRLRRLLRESFRLHVDSMAGAGMDCVVLARPAARAIDMRQKADRVIQDLIRRFKP